MAQLAMLPSPTFVTSRCEARSYVYLQNIWSPFTLNATSSYPPNHKLTYPKITRVYSKEKRIPPPPNVNTFEQINLRDPLDILCQTFFHIRCPGTGQTEGTIQYIHLSHCYLRLIQQPLHFTPSSIYLWQILLAMLMPIQSGSLDNNPTGLSILTTLKW